MVSTFFSFYFCFLKVVHNPFIVRILDNHEKLLDAESDLLPKILLPLAGPEEFDDEDNESLPLDLQYLPADKVREPNKDLRKMLVEIFMQVCGFRLSLRYSFISL